MEEEMSVEKEIKVICEAIKNDEGYRMSWQANIAMAFKDEWTRYLGENSDILTHQSVHMIANNAAKNFLDILIMDGTKQK